MAKATDTCPDCGQNMKNHQRVISTKCVDFNNLSVTESVFIALAGFLSVSVGVLYTTALV